MEKKCKYCAMMIPKDAKICPHCRKTLGMTMPVKIVIGLFLFAVIMSAITNKQPIGTSPSTSSSSPSQVQETALTVKGKQIKAKHPTWDNEDCNTIAEKKIHIGMTAEQVRAAWGKPYKINTTLTGNTTHEQWVMHEYGSDYVYFENGVMTSLQQSK
ncbi:MAG: hypothetical protein OEW04_01500 [Nitrospirota bacterium]|nr:hypothetical protein [Nitrospirota bacterium]